MIDAAIEKCRGEMLLKQIWRPFICATSALASSHNCKAVSFRAATVVNLPNPHSYGDDITGMASGDFNGDGRPDLVVTNGPAGVITILLYNRERNFEPFATYPAGSFPGAVAVGDFNHDGNLDIVVASQNSADFSILLGLGNGKFEPPITYPLPEPAFALAVADFNQDGNLDIAVGNSVYFGKGDSTFRSPVTFKAGNGVKALVAGDFNDDGIPDLAAACICGSNQNVATILSKGDGTFSNTIYSASGLVDSTLVAADFNGDGHLDLAVAGAGTSTVSLLFGDGNGEFQAPKIFTLPQVQPYSLAVGDFNGDGKPDLAVAASLSAIQESDVFVYVNAGDGSFELKEITFSGGSPLGGLTADFNGDGFTDFALASAGGDVWTYFGKGSGKFLLPLTETIDLGQEGLGPVVAGDFNHDGFPDLALLGTSNQLAILLNDGHGALGESGTYSVGEKPDGLITADLNGDGNLDLIASSASSNQIYVYLGSGNGAVYRFRYVQHRLQPRRFSYRRLQR